MLLLLVQAHECLSLFVCRSLDDGSLAVLGVYDGNHRRAIISKAHEAVASDFDNMLGDLSSVIRDLEAFTVVSEVAWQQKEAMFSNWYTCLL